MEALDREEVARHVQSALEEDVGSGDATTLSIVQDQATARARVIAREPLTLAGLRFANAAFHRMSEEVVLQPRKQDGERASGGEVLVEIEGPARAILTAERVALNYLQRLSGIATLTAAFVEAIAGTRARILDTRKTTPGWRRFEKYAVSCGGGTNHRFGLYDMVLIKDNHLAAVHGEAPNAIAAAVERARLAFPKLKIEVEVDTLTQLEQALSAGVEWVLLDNMDLEDLRSAVRMCSGRAQTEASGGVSLRTIRGIAETGVNFISVGALTHSARAVDIALDIE